MTLSILLALVTVKSGGTEILTFELCRPVLLQTILRATEEYCQNSAQLHAATRLRMCQGAPANLCKASTHHYLVSNALFAICTRK